MVRAVQGGVGAARVVSMVLRAMRGGGLGSCHNGASLALCLQLCADKAVTCSMGVALCLVSAGECLLALSCLHSHSASSHW